MSYWGDNLQRLGNSGIGQVKDDPDCVIYTTLSLPEKPPYPICLAEACSTLENADLIQLPSSLGDRTIWTMPPLYEPFENTCQHFVQNLVDLIVHSGRKQLQITSIESIATDWDNFVPLDLARTEHVKRKGKVSVGKNLAGKAESTALVDKQAAVVQNPDAQKKLLENVQAIMD